MIVTGHLTDTVPEIGEAFHVVLRHPHARIVHIVSSVVPDRGEYNQDDDEFVLVLQGSATMEVGGETVELGVGDHALLPAHTPHRVVRTEAGTHWLAVHLDATDRSS